MKKILAIALAAIMVLGLATSALAVSWAAPVTSATASPFAIEVIKLGVNSDITGAAYYTVLNDAAAYDYSTIYYAIKLSLPSYADANRYYGNSNFLNGNQVKVTINWTNVSGKSSQTVMVDLADTAQTLWFDGSKFTATWQQALNNSCGCGESHILSAIASGTKEVSVKACVGASGNLGDIKIGGCYSVDKKTFRGVVPCVNCQAQTLSGYMITGDCAANDVFFATNSADRVTGVYVADKTHKDLYFGAVEDAFTDTLYGWKVVGSYPRNCYGCDTDGRQFELRILNNTDIVVDNGTDTVTRSDANVTVTNIINGSSINDETELKTKFANWISDGYSKPTGVTPSTGDLFAVYTEKNGVYTKVEKKSYLKGYTEVWAGSQNSLTSDGKESVIASSSVTAGTVQVDPWNGTKTLFSGYKYQNPTTAGVYYLDAKVAKGVTSDARLFQQISATNVNCDGNDAGYLNTLNHVYSLLGFTFADVAAGNVYMNEDILLANFGFSTQVCDTATWGAYTAAITVAPVTEVPATGVASFAGFAMIAIAAAAATVAKKRD